MLRRIAIALLVLSAPWATGACDLAAPPPTPTTTRRAVLPPELVGTWETMTGQGVFSYVFVPDGRYAYYGIMASGGQSYTLVEGGRASVDGPVITIRPQTSKFTRRDRTDPVPSRQLDRTRVPLTLRWHVSGDTLTLYGDGDGDGKDDAPGVYRRSP
jgi:hypothetical protein